MLAFRLTSQRLIPIETASASPDELTRRLPRGLYTTFSTNHGGTRVLGLTAHLTRLFPSMEPAPAPSASPSDLRLALSQLAADNAPGESRFRVLVSDSDGTIYVIAQKFAPPAREVYERGVRVVTADLVRHDARRKDSSFIAESRSQRAQVGGEVYEVLLTKGGKIYEGMTSNFYAVAQNSFYRQAVAQNSFCRQAVAQNSFCRQAVAQNSFYRQAVAQNSFCRQAVAQNSFCRQAVAQNSFYRQAVAQNSFCRQAVAQNSFCRQAVAQNSFCRQVVAQNSFCRQVVAQNSFCPLQESQNEFYGTLVTARRGVLLGVTRRVVLRLARGEGMEVAYRAPRLDEDFAEAFITSSSRGIVPIVQIDGRAVGQGGVGAWTKRLSLAYAAYVEERSERLVG